MATAAPAASIDIGRVIGRGVDALGRNLLAFAGLALLLGAAPALAIDYLFEGVFSDVAFAGPFWTYPAAGFVVDFLFGSLLSAILVRSSILTLNGDEADLGGSALTAVRLLPRLVALALLATLVILFGLILLIVPGIIFTVGLAVAEPVLIVERKGVVASMHRSAELTAGNRGRIFLLILLYWLLWIAFLGGTELAFAAEATAWSGGPPTGAAIAYALATGAGTLIWGVMAASLYVELRTVKEGATSESLVEIFE